MRVLGLVGRALMLAPLAVWACSSGDPKGDEPVATEVGAALWAPTTNTMSSPRADAAAAALGDGRVIVCGGRSAASTFLGTCDIYNPTTNTWSAGPTLPQLRGQGTLTALGANSLLFAGGLNTVPVATAAVGSSTSWTSEEAITGRYLHTASLLSNGTLLLTGGFNQVNTVAAAQRRVGAAWSAAGTQARYAHAAVVLASGTDVLAVGGADDTGTIGTAAIYNAASNAWTATVAMPELRRNLRGVLLSDGSVLVVGGHNGATFPANAIRQNPSTGAWTTAGSPVARAEHGLALLNGYVIAVGGRTTNTNVATTSVQSYNPSTNVWADLEPLVTARSGLTLTPLPGGRLLAAGGSNGTTFYNTAEVLTPIAIAGACTAGTQDDCLSGYCADSACCNTACTGQCQACNESGLAGTCSPVSGPPRGSRGNCANGYVCVSGSCATSCTSDTQCQSTYYCTTSGTPGVCALKKVQGDPCSGASQCGAGLFCTDGRCCNAACNGQCEHCDANGACIVTTQYSAPVAPRAACGGAGSGTLCGASCSGVDTAPGRTSCAFPGALRICQTASCTNGVAALASGCNGSGACSNQTQNCGAYVCDSTSCRTSCTTNGHCASNHFCDNGTCAPLRAKGQDCTAGGQCVSGNCVNQVCCDSPSCATGSSCATTAHKGDCRKLPGTACTGGTECGSDHCADNVCCDTACTGQCERCNASGICSATIGAPVGARPACGGSGAGTICGQSCNGTSRTQCVYAGLSQTCRAAACSDGTAILTQHCDGNGICPDSTVPCGAYTCDALGQGCRTSCDVRADCAPGHLCDTNVNPHVCVPIPGLGADCQSGSECSTTYCVNSVCCGSQSCPADSSCALSGFRGQCKRNVGAVCTGNAECGSQRCVDGRCCNSDCDGQCEACNVQGEEGTCVPVPVDDGVPHGNRAACQTVPNTCGPRCDGANTDSCTSPGTGSACGVRSCSNGIETRTGTCNGSGECSGATRDCGAYACGRTACKTSCSTSDDCAEDYFCAAGECVPTLGPGRDCDENTACVSGYCVDGVCCESRSCSTGSTCAFAGHHGECTQENGTACTDNDQCGSEHCVDGYCCNNACEGQCEACNVTGRLGACSPVEGDPHGSRPSCDAGAGLCGRRSCDGAASTDECVGYENGTDTQCASAVCDGVEFTPGATCDGAGACQEPETTRCVPYVCTEDGCLSACDDNTACAEGYHCAEGECIASTATCSEDRSMSIPVDGPPEACAPYRCTTDGTCATGCQSSSECASGNACDASTTPGQCKAIKAAGANDEGGCGCSTPGKLPRREPAVWLLVLGAMVARRKRLHRASN